MYKNNLFDHNVSFDDGGPGMVDQAVSAALRQLMPATPMTKHVDDHGHDRPISHPKRWALCCQNRVCLTIGFVAAGPGIGKDTEHKVVANVDHYHLKRDRQQTDWNHHCRKCKLSNGTTHAIVVAYGREVLDSNKPACPSLPAVDGTICNSRIQPPISCSRLSCTQNQMLPPHEFAHRDAKPIAHHHRRIAIDEQQCHGDTKQ